MNSRLELKTGDEIEVLAEEFNKMAENLHRAMTN
jgi:HAMP domain-containing protein